MAQFKDEDPSSGSRSGQRLSNTHFCSAQFSGEAPAAAHDASICMRQGVRGRGRPAACAPPSVGIAHRAASLLLPVSTRGTMGAVGQWHFSAFLFSP